MKEFNKEELENDLRYLEDIIYELKNIYFKLGDIENLIPGNLIHEEDIYLLTEKRYEIDELINLLETEDKPFLLKKIKNEK